SVLERRAAVSAVELEKSRASAAVAEEHQVLAHDLDALGQVAGPELVGEGDRMPEAAQVLPAGRARADVGELGILGRRVAFVVRRIRLVEVHRSPFRYAVAAA